jgi:hypothetical protein
VRPEVAPIPVLIFPIVARGVMLCSVVPQNKKPKASMFHLKSGCCSWVIFSCIEQGTSISNNRGGVTSQIFYLWSG